MIASQTLAAYLDRLSARESTPGGGAAGAVHAAQGAALVGMVARYSTGPRYAAYEAETTRILARTDELVPAALRLADEDATAFATVIAAYRMPSGSEQDRAARTEAVQAALVEASRPPRTLIGLAAEIVELGEELALFGNPSVLSDVAAAAEAARAAAATALVTLRINIASIDDAAVREELGADVLRAERAGHAAQALSARVGEMVAA